VKNEYNKWTYEELVGELDNLRDLIMFYAEMTPEQEAGYREGWASAGGVLPGDFRDELTIKEGDAQVEIVRECLRRVTLKQLADDTGFSEEALIGFAAHTANPRAN
jgi:hypothetical protein